MGTIEEDILNDINKLKNNLIKNEEYKDNLVIIDNLIAYIELKNIQEDGIENWKTELGKILDCEDEPRWKWLYLHAKQMKERLIKLEEFLTTVRKELIKHENKNGN